MLTRPICQPVELLYGLRYMSFNIYSLLHLPDVARNLGPLSHSSCFALEALDGKIKKWVQGGIAPERRILKFLCAAQTMPTYVEQLNSR